MADQPMPFTDVWRALMELGAALNAMKDLPDELCALREAVEEAYGLVEERALEECAIDG